MDKTMLEKVGDEQQLYSARQYRLCGGKADGMRMIELKSFAGLRAEIAADRCMDLYRLEYKGVNLGYMTAAGMVSSKYYQSEDFLRSFTAGFFTTCGLKNVGAGCVDLGEEAVVHGRIGNTPADRVNVDVVEEDGETILTASGVMREAIIFGEKLELKRKITMDARSAYIRISDTVTNFGGETQPLELLYHMNMGYPLLDAFSEITIPAEKTSARDARAQEGIEDWMYFCEPVSGFAEQCYDHVLYKKDGKSAVMIFNPKLNIGVVIELLSDTLDHFTEWKMPGVKDYVLGLEPGNANVLGRAAMRESGELKFIEPGEKVHFELGIRIIDGSYEYETAKRRIFELAR